jgi:hypothetical protein
MSDEMVRMHDSETGEVVTVPKRELRPGMIQARCMSKDGRLGEIVWHDPASLKRARTFKHDPFPADIREVLEEIRVAFHDVRPRTQANWEDGFRYDMHPTREIRLWLHAARVFKHFTEHWDHDADQKAHMFRVIVECLNNGRNHLLLKEGPRTLSRRRVQAITDYFFTQEPPTVPLVITSDPDYRWMVEIRRRLSRRRLSLQRILRRASSFSSSDGRIWKLPEIAVPKRSKRS